MKPHSMENQPLPGLVWSTSRIRTRFPWEASGQLDDCGMAGARINDRQVPRTERTEGGEHPWGLVFQEKTPSCSGTMSSSPHFEWPGRLYGTMALALRGPDRDIPWQIRRKEKHRTSQEKWYFETSSWDDIIPKRSWWLRLNAPCMLNPCTKLLLKHSRLQKLDGQTKLGVMYKFPYTRYQTTYRMACRRDFWLFGCFLRFDTLADCAVGWTEQILCFQDQVNASSNRMICLGKCVIDS